MFLSLATFAPLCCAWVDVSRLISLVNVTTYGIKRVDPLFRWEIHISHLLITLFHKMSSSLSARAMDLQTAHVHSAESASIFCIFRVEPFSGQFVMLDYKNYSLEYLMRCSNFHASFWSFEVWECGPRKRSNKTTGWTSPKLPIHLQYITTHTHMHTSIIICAQAWNASKVASILH